MICCVDKNHYETMVSLHQYSKHDGNLEIHSTSIIPAHFHLSKIYWNEAHQCWV